MNYPLHIVDVFAEKPLTGNQLGVVKNASELTGEQMQDIARELNFSETTFITGQSGDGYDVRIFTPEWELPFAGHPTLGTAWVLSGGTGQIQLNLGVGPVSVRFGDDGLGWITPPDPALDDPCDDRALAAAAVSLNVADLADLPVVRADVGPTFFLIPLADEAALNASAPEPVAWATLNERFGDGMLFLFARTNDNPDQISARMYFKSGSVREDPATGSANSCLARYLFHFTAQRGIVTVMQGVAMKRPSKLLLDVDSTVRIGGNVIETVRGELTL